MKYLILGGIRSGKSRHAEQLAKCANAPITYVATAQALDDDMQRRIQSHAARRPSHWTLIEAPIELAQALEINAAPNHCILVDCLTLWVTNLLHHSDTNQLQYQTDALIRIIPHLPGDLIVVSNEVGLGGIANNALARQFCDHVGQLHQSLAEHFDSVQLVVAGRALELPKISYV